MKKFMSLAICAVAAGVVVFKMHSQTAVAGSQVVGNSAVVQSTSESSAQEDGFIDKVKKANKVIVPENKGRSTTPELTLEQAKAFEGTITNKYGIRDDVYEFIQANVPKDNPRALNAAIKFTQYENQMYYHAATKHEALEIHKKNVLALECLSKYLPNDWLKIAKGSSKLMHNTSERDKRMWDIDEKYFGWEVLGTGLSSSEEDKKCKEGNF